MATKQAPRPVRPRATSSPKIASSAKGASPSKDPPKARSSVPRPGPKSVPRPAPKSVAPKSAPPALRAEMKTETRDSLHSVDLIELPAPPTPPRSVPPPVPSRTSVPPPISSSPLAVLTSVPPPPPSSGTAERLHCMSIRPEAVLEEVRRLSSVPPAPPSAPPSIAPAPPPKTLAPAPTPRVSLIDLIDQLFDTMHDLVYFETAAEGASYCLASLLRLMPCRAGLVHLYDLASREFVVVYAQGPWSERMLLSRAPEDDSLLSTAIHKHRPEVVVYDRGDDDAVRLDRHALFGETKSILVAPIMDGARFLGGIELVDPLTEFDVRAENAVMYVCDRYAQFLREHGTAIGNVVAPPSGIVFTSSDAPPKDEDARAAAG